MKQTWPDLPGKGEAALGDVQEGLHGALEASRLRDAPLFQVADATRGGSQGGPRRLLRPQPSRLLRPLPALLTTWSRPVLKHTPAIKHMRSHSYICIMALSRVALQSAMPLKTSNA